MSLPSSHMPIMPVTYATATAEAVATFVAEHYDLQRASCALLNRGFNDVYGVTTEIGDRFILRLSGMRARGPADVGAETAFLGYLDDRGVPVAAAVPTKDGGLFTVASMPDGERPAVLFHYVEGRRPDLDDPDDARVQGVALARLHLAGDDFPDRASGRYRLDLDHLLHRPVAAVLALGLEAPTVGSDLAAIASRLARSVESMDHELTRTRCHGDCHGLNARIAETGPHAGHAVLFDFDDGGLGYLAYDLAVHLWAQVSFGRRRHAMWHAFDAGYRSQRAVAAADEAAISLFVPIRHIWLMGEYASRTAEWGNEVLSAAWLRREVAFLLAWEQTKLSPHLL